MRPSPQGAGWGATSACGAVSRQGCALGEVAPEREVVEGPRRPLRVLFYVEPLIEMGLPYWKKCWADTFIQTILDALEQSGSAVDTAVCLGEAIREHLPPRAGQRVVSFSQRELLAPFPGGNYLDASIAWQQGSFSAEQLGAYRELVAGKLGDFVPDAIISFSPVPFLQQAFPRAVVLHMEYSFFSRRPYPQSWYLDPVGKHISAFYERFAEAIQARQLDAAQRERLRRFKARAQALLRDNDPFAEWMRQQRQRYRALVLLPLQFSGYVLFDAVTHYRSQYELLVDVLERVPADVGVVVTTHPEYNILSHSVKAYLRKTYPNFVHSERFEEVYAPSQFLIAHVDAVLNVSSNVGLQTLIWDRKLLALAPVFESIADGRGLERLEEVLATESDPEHKERVLHFLLTHYTILEHYLRDPAWIVPFLWRCIGRFRDEGVTAAFYTPIEAEEQLFARLEASLNGDIPEPAQIVSYSKDRLIERLRQAEEELAEERQAKLEVWGSAQRSLAALEAVLKTLSRGRLSAELLLQVGLSCLSLGLDSNAEVFFRRLLRKKPQDDAAIAEVGRSYLARGQPERARVFFEQALAANPASSLAREGLAHVGQRLPQ